MGKRLLWHNFWIKFMATGAGTGYGPLVSGTYGSLVGVVMFMAMIGWPRWLFLITVMGLTALGIWVSDEAERLFEKKDPSYVVIDEIIGLLIAMLFLPFRVKYVLIAFFVFRVMDVIKPYPARQGQELHGGLGIVIDDVVAGIYTGIIVLILTFIFKI